MGYSIEEKIGTISFVIWSAWCSTFKLLIKNDIFNKLNLETFSKVALEFLLLYINFCDREIFQLVETKERDIIMSGIVSDTSKRLEKYDENLLIKLAGEETSKNISQYFIYWSKVAYSINFVNLYNERQLEYSAFKELAPQKDESPKNTLLWEFGKKINTIVLGRPDDIVILMHTNIIAMEMFKVLLGSLKPTFKK